MVLAASCKSDELVGVPLGQGATVEKERSGQPLLRQQAGATGAGKLDGISSEVFFGACFADRELGGWSR